MRKLKILKNLRLRLPEFREQIAFGLLHFSSKPSVSRPSSIQAMPLTSTPKTSRASTPNENAVPGALPVGRRSIHPFESVRFSGNNHLPIWLEKKHRSVFRFLGNRVMNAVYGDSSLSMATINKNRITDQYCLF